jgi:hypothetical protein
MTPWKEACSKLDYIVLRGLRILSNPWPASSNGAIFTYNQPLRIWDAILKFILGYCYQLAPRVLGELDLVIYRAKSGSHSMVLL